MTPEQFRDALLDGEDRAAAEHLAAATGTARHDALVVLGSGLAPLADAWAQADPNACSGRLSDLPGVLAPTADGHVDRWLSLAVGGRRTLVTLGRTHLYEGVPRRSVTALVRVAAAAGVGRVMLTNANGCLVERALGDVVAIGDHVNLTGSSPFDGTVFLDPRDTWDTGLRSAVGAIDGVRGEAVYAQLRGPEYQTMAETRLLAASGVEVVGMSTVHEALVARALGLRVAGLSVVSDLSFATAPVDADTVLAAAGRARETLRAAVEAALGAP
ncbi:MAG TPA: purine-nucleoside phosphorylase [Micrococcales bacterium]|uniref:purine-nucleoside phosphorylase n=1 Tax=Miniimonas arenae TaxID=676201 RepID=UPI000EDBCC25|nr:purine-nucleoside phosphorylase [Miniimonas arenae]HCX84340.1 purine-nucleoside phosphorylase [Micrococcales bacterium]